MILKCDCIGCQNIRKFARPKSCFEYKKSVKPECNENCIPKENVYKNFERDVNTSDIYRTVNIPDRFERSCTLNGYGIQYKKYDPIFRTTSQEYGWIPPNAHTVPHRFHPLSNRFSELLVKTGMYRNYSLNTELDKSRV